jgi:hypothetical protein
MSERPIQRSSPPFGELPRLVEGDLELLVTFESGSLSLAGFFCSPHGVTASFRAALLTGDEAAAPFAFEHHAPPVAATALDIWAQQLGDEDPGSRIYANLARGGGGSHGPVRAAHYNLWFPLDPRSLRTNIEFVISWSQLGGQRPSLTVPKEALQEAAAHADERFAGLA